MGVAEDLLAGKGGHQPSQEWIGDELFLRSWKVTIDTIETTEHDVSFKVTKSVKPEPNKCELKIFNLNAKQRAQIEELQPETNVAHVGAKKLAAAVRRKATKGIGVKIEAGYQGKNSLIWLGDLRTADSTFSSPDWTTELKSGDGVKSWQNARVNVSYGPKTPVATVIHAIAKSMGIGEGNLAAVIAKKGLATKLVPQGTVVFGSARVQMTDWCNQAELEWSIQDGVLQFIDRGKKLDQTAIKLTPSTGLLDSPTVDVDGILTVKTLMIPDLRPGRLLVVEAGRIHGNYRAEQIVYDGDTSGKAWGATVKAVTY